MNQTINSSGDVVTFLKRQHQEVKSLLERVSATRGKDREAAFMSLRRTMAIHETAEEEVVHPAARRAIPNGESIVDARLHEEKGAKKALSELENLNVDSDEFEVKFRKLKANVLAHAESEEHDEFAQLAGRFTPEHLTRMRKAAEFAESIAPTRPHPGIESAAANMLVGPFASMVDRLRDAFADAGRDAKPRQAHGTR